METTLVNSNETGATSAAPIHRIRCPTAASLTGRLDADDADIVKISPNQQNWSSDSKNHFDSASMIAGQAKTVETMDATFSFHRENIRALQSLQEFSRIVTQVFRNTRGEQPAQVELHPL